jgi:chromate reductase
MADTLEVLTICGSLRKGSYNAALVRALPALAPAGMTLKAAPSFAGFALYNADLHSSGSFPAEVNAFADAIRAADGVLVVSPEYNWSTPGVLKNAIDWVSRMKEQPFKDKPVALQSASTGPLGASRMQYHLRMTLTSIDALIFGRPEIFVTFANKKFDETGALADEPTREIVRTQLAGFAAFIRKVGGRT